MVDRQGDGAGATEMAGELIVPDQLPAWVPGEVTVRSPDDAWDGVCVRGYRYEDSDVEVPPMRDYMIVAYRRGVTDMRRRLDGGWHHEQLGPGDVSLLTRAAHSHWRWDTPVEVVHVYLTHDQLASTCRAMYGREVEDVELHDTIKADDPGIHRTAMAIAGEAAEGGVGSELLVDSLTRFAESFGDTEGAKALFDAGRTDAPKGKGSLTVLVALERS